jgi:hypothetical protein
MNPIELNTEEILATNENILSVLNQYGVAIVSLNDITDIERNDVLDTTQFYKTANAIFKEDFQIEEPTLEEKLNPSIYKHRKAGDDAAGWLHEYGTPIHYMLQENPTLRLALSTIYDNGALKYAPNRLRICRKFKNDANSLHIEGKDIFNLEDPNNMSIIPGEIATIIGLTGVRRFIFWDLNGTDIKPLYDYWKSSGSKEFTSINPEFMNSNYPDCRRVVNIDCRENPYLIVWRETTPHEVAHSPSLSAYISPINEFNNKLVRSVTKFQPDCFNGLTYHDTNLLALCYNMGGYEWPSGKKLYQFCHHRAYTHYIPKIKPRYLDSDGKFKMMIIEGGTINQHNNQYKEELRTRGIYIPNVVFDANMPNFVVDILELSDTILRDFGFIN